MKRDNRKGRKKDEFELQVLYEDNHIIAVNKPGGWLVQGDSTGDKTLADFVKEYIKKKYDKPGDVFLGTIHRLDRPVSGVVIYARTTKGLQRMNELFKNREIEKTYWAITLERPKQEEGTLIHWIKKDTTKNVALALDAPSNRSKDAKKGELDYKLLAQIGSLPLLEVKPKTGRPHQIRVQLAKIGCPIKADVKYGAHELHPDLTIYLHARSLSFIHPIRKEPIFITCNPPKESTWYEFKHLFHDSKYD